MTAPLVNQTLLIGDGELRKKKPKDYVVAQKINVDRQGYAINEITVLRNSPSALLMTML